MLYLRSLPPFTFMLMIVIIIIIASCYYPLTLNMHLFSTVPVAATLPRYRSSVANWPPVLCCSKKSPPIHAARTPNML